MIKDGSVFLVIIMLVVAIILCGVGLYLNNLWLILVAACIVIATFFEFA